MELNGTYRHELKYQINYADYCGLSRRLKLIMKADCHANDNGLYKISSIYFDNYNDKALKEKINGVQKREKIRIRYYNDDLSFITLEKKIKHNDLCMKVDALISYDDYQRILTQPGSWMLEHPQELVRELYYKMKVQQLRPRTLISYIREPYVYDPGNVRVTFDSKIRTSLFQNNFLDNQITDVPASDTPNDIILEVKYDAYLPETIRCLLQVGNLRQVAFSKYGTCRRFG